MTYADAIAYLDRLIDYERRPLPQQARAWNLDRTRALLEALGNPHHSLKCIHIAGTKGKGSTAAFTASILRAAGYRVGLYTSPHLVDFRERIRLDGACIPKRDAARLVAQLRPHVERMKRTLPFPPSFFEVYTALALRWFADRQADFAVLETGLGGRLDATSAVTPLVSIITTIGLDHTAELGPTIAHIAREKAGIIKPGVPVVCAPQRRDAAREIRRAARRQGASLHLPRATPAGPRRASAPAATQAFSLAGPDGKPRTFRIALLGGPQIINASLAVTCAQLLGLPAAAIGRGLAAARWPGRFHVLPGKPAIVLDCAHDGISAQALAHDMRAAFPGSNITLILGISADKDAASIIRPLAQIAQRVITTRAALPRAADPASLALLVKGRRPVEAVVPVSAALRRALLRTDKTRHVILVTGSIYIVGEAMQALGFSPCDLRP